MIYTTYLIYKKKMKTNKNIDEESLTILKIVNYDSCLNCRKPKIDVKSTEKKCYQTVNCT